MKGLLVKLLLFSLRAPRYSSQKTQRLCDIIQNFLLKKYYVSQLGKLKTVDGFNVGCGSEHVKGWLNIGIFNGPEYPQGLMVRKDNGSLVLNIDINRVNPFLFGSVKYVYASHFIEHLTRKQAKVFLSQSYKGMRKGGVIRLTCPDLELWVNKYYENDMDFFDYYKSNFLRDSDLETKGEIFMGQCHGFEHLWNYDFESLRNMMKKIGFSNITKKAPLDSVIPEIAKLETTRDTRVFETVHVEGLKE